MGDQNDDANAVEAGVEVHEEQAMKCEGAKGVLLAVLITACIGVYGQQFGPVPRQDQDMLTVVRTRLLECAEQSPLWRRQPTPALTPQDYIRIEMRSLTYWTVCGG